MTESDISADALREVLVMGAIAEVDGAVDDSRRL